MIYLKVLQLLLASGIMFCLFDKIATDRYYRWWCKYGSDNAWRKKNGLPPKPAPREPWLGSWNFIDVHEEGK